MRFRPKIIRDPNQRQNMQIDKNINWERLANWRKDNSK